MPAASAQAHQCPPSIAAVHIGTRVMDQSSIEVAKNAVPALASAEPGRRTDRAPRSARLRRRILASWFMVRRLTCWFGRQGRGGEWPGGWAGGWWSPDTLTRCKRQLACSWFAWCQTSACGGAVTRCRQCLPRAHRQLVCEALVVDAGLRLRVRQRCPAADDRLGELAGHHLCSDMYAVKRVVGDMWPGRRLSARQPMVHAAGPPRAAGGKRR